ncbi:MAG: adenosine kinase [Pseudomonadota bacterium]
MTFGLTGLGNTPVDLLAMVDDAFLQTHGLAKGQYTKIDTLRAVAIERALAHVTMSPGGGVGNAVACYATLGGHAAFMGAIADDDWGDSILADFQRRNVTCPSPITPSYQATTKRLFCLVTPDAERSFAGYPGASPSPVFDMNTLCLDTLTRSNVLLLDGYLLGKDSAVTTFVKAIVIIKAQGGQVAFMPGDVAMLRDQAEHVRTLLPHIDAVMLNEAEACYLHHSDDMKMIFDALMNRFKYGSVTLGAQGAFVFQNGRGATVAAAPLPRSIIDTTGAGDAFAGGFLYGLHHGYDLARAGQIGAACAADVIGNYGARLPVGFRLPGDLFVV